MRQGRSSACDSTTRALLALALGATVPLERGRQRVRPRKRPAQARDDRLALGRTGERLADLDGATLLGDGDLVARVDADALTNRLGQHHLTLDAHLISHTLSITID